MNKVSLVVPKLKDYWYEAKVLSDPLSMSYNSGWDVSYEGYNYDTGCIDFPKEKWREDFLRRKKPDKNFFYILDKESKQFVGYISYYYSMGSNHYNCSLVIEYNHRGKGYAREALILLFKKAKRKGIKALYDDFEENREGVKLFKELGFVEVNNYMSKRFKKNIKIIEVKKVL